jgi:transposase InsO family protein
VSAELLCSLLGKSRQAHYKQLKNRLIQSDQTSVVVADVINHRRDLPRTGTIKLLAEYQAQWAQQGIKVGRDKLFSVLSENRLLIRARRRRVRTTFSNHLYRKSPDLAKTFIPQEPHELYVADITYLPLRSGEFCYLFLMTDAYSHAIVGHKVAKDLGSIHARDVLRMAEMQRDKSKSTIHHSDRGFHYCMPAYKNSLLRMGYQPSNTQTSDPRDNPVAERINGILKHELLFPFGLASSVEVAQEMVNKAVDIYNNKRLHLSCNLKTPMQIHDKSFKAKATWKRKSFKSEQSITSPDNLNPEYKQ